MRKVCSSAAILVISIGCDEKYIPRMYSLGFFFSAGASGERIMNSLSKRCIINGTQARAFPPTAPSVLEIALVARW